MTKGTPILDPTQDLKGATPKKLARALFRKSPGEVVQPVAGNEVSVKQVSSDQPGNGTGHMNKRS